MGQTTKQAKTPAKVYPGPVIFVSPDPSITDEEREKNRATIEWLRQRVEAAERMTPEEKRQADQDWENFKSSVNEARGRKVIGDD